MYEAKGLVTPQRTSGNTRMYSQADIERLEFINELTNEGINLAGVIRILDLQGRLNDRDAELDDLHKRVRRLADRVHELETRESVNSLVRVRDLPTFTVQQVSLDPDAGSDGLNNEDDLK